MSNLTYLDTIPCPHAEVGYGELGTHGRLGYEGHGVDVNGLRYDHALSAHPPSRLRFTLGRRFAAFRCRVALTDDVPINASHADFLVYLDGVLAAEMPNVVAGEPPRDLAVACVDATELELVVRTSRWDISHAAWLDPELDTIKLSGSQRLNDCLGRVEMELPTEPIRAETCIATIVSPGFEPWLETLLRSLAANGACADARVVILVVDSDDSCLRSVFQAGALPVHCRSLKPINATVKSALYSAARIVDAKRYLCLDADMLILGDLRPLLHALDAFREGSILVARDAYLGNAPLADQLCGAYGGRPSDLERLLGAVRDEGSYNLIVNDGLFAGSRGAMLALDGVIRGMREAPVWVDELPDHGWRNQFVFNLALARLNSGVEISPVYNWQIHAKDIDVDSLTGAVLTRGGGQPIRGLHFCGLGKSRYAEIRDRFTSHSGDDEPRRRDAG